MKKVFITLEITYDEKNVIHPEKWDWNTLVDINPNDNIRVVKSEESEADNERDSD